MSSSSLTKYWQDAYRTRRLSIPDIDAYHNDAGAVMQLWENEHKLLASLATQAKVDRNRLCRAVALPTELLSLVFEFAKLMWPTHPSSKGPDAWLPVTQVCSWWRSVALGHTPLWSTISLSLNRPLTEMMVERSRTLPLHVSCNLNRLCSMSCLEMLMNRSKTLHISGDFKCQRSIAEDAFAPNLESLALFTQCGSESRCITSTFITNHSHTLRHVAVQCFPSPWSTTFTNIESLSLCRSHLTPYPASTFRDEPYTPEEILTGLTKMPHLKVLSLKHVIPDLTKFQRPTRVPLPNLHKLSLTGSESSCIPMSKLLDIPSDASISVVYRDDYWQNSTPAQFSTWFSMAKSSRFTHLRITVRYDYMIVHFTMDRRHGYANISDGIFDQDRHSSPEFYLCCPITRRTDKVQYDFAIAAATAFPLESFCIIGNEITWQLNQFKNFFAQASTLKRVEYISTKSYPQYLVKALGSKGNDGRVVCPTLETVCIYGITICQTAFSQELADSLKVRVRGGFGLQTLQLIDYGPAADDTIALLKMCAKEVELLKGIEIREIWKHSSELDNIYCEFLDAPLC